MTDLCFTKWDVCYRPNDLAPWHFFYRRWEGRTWHGSLWTWLVLHYLPGTWGCKWWSLYRSANHSRRDSTLPRHSLTPTRFLGDLWRGEQTFLGVLVPSTVAVVADSSDLWRVEQTFCVHVPSTPVVVADSTVLTVYKHHIFGPWLSKPTEELWEQGLHWRLIGEKGLVLT